MTESIHTLQEFMMQTKAIIYILGVGFLVGFVAFYRYLNRNENDKELD